MHGGVALEVIQHAEHLGLDPGGLDLDEQHGAVPHQAAGFGEGRHAARRVGGAGRDLLRRERRNRCPVGENGVVMHNRDPVGGAVDVELDGVRARLQRERKGGKGVLTGQSGHAPVGDAERDGGHGAIR